MPLKAGYIMIDNAPWRVLKGKQCEALIKERNDVNGTDNVQLSHLISQITDGSKDVKAREVAMNLMLANLRGRWTCPICDNACKTKQSLTWPLL